MKNGDEARRGAKKKMCFSIFSPCLFPMFLLHTRRTLQNKKGTTDSLTNLKHLLL